MKNDNKDFHIGLVILMAAILASIFSIIKFGFNYSSRALTIAALVLFLFTMAAVIPKLLTKIVTLAVSAIRLLGKVSKIRLKQKIK